MFIVAASEMQIRDRGGFFTHTILSQVIDDVISVQATFTLWCVLI